MPFSTIGSEVEGGVMTGSTQDNALRKYELRKLPKLDDLHIYKIQKQNYCTNTHC